MTGEYNPSLSLEKALTVSDLTMFEDLKRYADHRPDLPALEFFDRLTSYAELISKVECFARFLVSKGVSAGDNVMVCMPNCPQAVIAIYGCNRIGAVAVMIHPLSVKAELVSYIASTDCRIAVTLDMFMDRFPDTEGTTIGTVVVADMADELSSLKAVGYRLTEGRKNYKPKFDGARVMRWKDAMRIGSRPMELCSPSFGAEAPATIIFSGGSTGEPKGAVIPNRCYTYSAEATMRITGFESEGKKFLTILPLFHGFGLLVCLHLPIVNGCRCILVPRFTADSCAEMIVAKKPTYMAGVPALFEHLIKNKTFQSADLSFVRGLFCGGDTFTVDCRARVDTFLKEHGADIKVIEGYGCAECLSIVAASANENIRPGSVGMPLEGMDIRIFEAGTSNELPAGEPGEICISGPIQMSGYYKNEEATEKTVLTHPDGKRWVHTGDMGKVDDDGYIYFMNRIKRMIVTSGYNVYPEQVERVLKQHPAVAECCVIGVPDAVRGMRIKAFLVLSKGYRAEGDVVDTLKAYMKANIVAYAKPREYEIRDSLPLTKVGKVSFRALQDEEAAKLAKGSDA